MKKIFGFLIFLVLFFNVSPTFAAAPITVPTCDPTKVLIDNRTSGSFYTTNFGKINYIQVAYPSPSPVNYDNTYTTQAEYDAAAASCASAPLLSGGGHSVSSYSFCDATPLIYGTNRTYSGCWPIVDAGAANTLTEKSIQIQDFQHPCPSGCSLSGAVCEINGHPGTTCNLLPAGKTFDCPTGYGLNPSSGTCYLTTPVAVSGAAPISGPNIKVHLCTPSDGTCDTALGQIPIDPAAFTAALLKLLVAISGIVILIMSIIAGYNVMTSSGDPQKLASSKEMIISLVGGIVLIVFSIVLLQAIGVDILGIPGLQEHLSTTGIR